MCLLSLFYKSNSYESYYTDRVAQNTYSSQTRSRSLPHAVVLNSQEYHTSIIYFLLPCSLSTSVFQWSALEFVIPSISICILITNHDYINRRLFNLTLGDYGNIGGIRSPSSSGKPMIRFMFWTACPAAPFTRLSIAPITTTRFVRGSITKFTST